MSKSILIIGAGIGGLTAAVAFLRKGYTVEMVEKDPTWTVYGVGIIQQFNVIRAMHSLGMLDAYISEAFGYDQTTMYAPNGDLISQFDAPRMAGEQYPANAGIRRTALQKVLATTAQDLGATVRLGLEVDDIQNDADAARVSFSDGTKGTYDFVIGADGVFSKTRDMILPNAPKPRYTGQWVWRYNFPKPDSLEGIELYMGPKSAGLVPIGNDLMYMFVLTEEAADFHQPTKGAAEALRNRLDGAAPQIIELGKQITDDAEVVGRPLEVVLLKDEWHVGRVVLLGDAIHASTPHLAQGAGMAIEDGIVLADEVSKTDDIEAAFTAFRARRFERCRYVAETSILIGDIQMGKEKPVDVNALMSESFVILAKEI
ncbi:MAG: 2-polyprenyl-6-methoxyphenol hydroxylase [Rhodobacteraceae bacterium]|nr:MAG: 2-polyprenyl-6-methoxyphenol hydroxylase [Paracoccaceae bacterium]